MCVLYIQSAARHHQDSSSWPCLLVLCRILSTQNHTPINPASVAREMAIPTLNVRGENLTVITPLAGVHRQICL